MEERIAVRLSTGNRGRLLGRHVTYEGENALAEQAKDPRRWYQEAKKRARVAYRNSKGWML